MVPQKVKRRTSSETKLKIRLIGKNYEYNQRFFWFDPDLPKRVDEEPCYSWLQLFLNLQKFLYIFYRLEMNEAECNEKRNGFRFQ